MTNTQAAPAQHIIAIIDCTNHEQARAYTAQLRGKTLAAVVELAGCTVYGPVAQRRQILADYLIGRALDSAAIRFHGDPAAHSAWLSAYRTHHIAALAG